MKYKKFSVLLICHVLVFLSLIAGYESTEQEERKEQLAGEEHDADLTSRAEEIERIADVDDAKITERQEDIENLTPVNDASETSRQELAEQLSEYS